MATIVGLTNGAGQHPPPADPAIGSLVQRLSKLRADIVAGRHSRFRVPEHLLATALSANPGSQAESLAEAVPGGPPTSVSAKFASRDDVPNPQTTQTSGSVPVPPVAPDPNESLQQRRRELEKVLEEQVLQKRQLSKQKPCDQEIIADFDVTETLRLAQERVKPWRPSDSVSANRSRSSSGSFDENTFYSSQMNESTTTEELEPPKNPKRPLRACRFFRSGKECPYGKTCTFSHDPQVVKKIEAEEQQRAAKQQDKNNEQSSKRAGSVPRKAAAKNNAQVDVPPDPQATRIAELEAQLAELKNAKEPRAQKPKLLPQAIERSEEEPEQVRRISKDSNKSYSSERKDDSSIKCRPPAIPPPIDKSMKADDVLHLPQPHVPVIRNHITTPQAPQPARVSPLTGAKPSQVVRLQRTHNDDAAQSNASSTEYGSARQSPAVVPPTKGGRKRKRPQHVEDNSRNVASRTHNVQSPGVYIKEEPVSPPPLNGMTRLQAVPQQSTETHRNSGLKVPSRAIAQAPSDDEDGPYVFEPLILPEKPSTPRRQVPYNQAQHAARDERDLRRVVSTKSLRQEPPSPTYNPNFSDPQPRFVRAASTVQYVHDTREPLQPLPPPPQYRASVQPAFRDTRSQPRQIELTPDRPQIITMAPPPPRRIVVGSDGRRYAEVPLPPDPPMPMQQFQSVAADGQIYHHGQPAQYEEPTRYVQRVETPPSPRYAEYQDPGRKGSVIRVEQNGYEYEQYQPSSRVVRYTQQPTAQYEEVRSYQEERPRSQHMQAAEEQYEPQVRESVSRIGSTRPSQPSAPPRLVRLEQNEDAGSRATRQISVQPESVQYGQVPIYQYAHSDSQGQNYGVKNGEGQTEMYDPGRTASKRVLRM